MNKKLNLLTNIELSDILALDSVLYSKDSKDCTNFNIELCLGESNPAKYCFSFKDSKYFSQSNYLLRLLDISCEVHDNMSYPLDKVNDIIRDMEKKELKENEIKFLENCKKYILNHEKSMPFIYGSGNCKDSTDLMGKLIDEKINNNEKQIYWISAVFPTIYSKHAMLLAFDKEGNWMSLEGKTIIDEYDPFDRLFLPPSILKKKFPKNVF
jgi:hypothetical protein